MRTPLALLLAVTACADAAPGIQGTVQDSGAPADTDAVAPEPEQVAVQIDLDRDGDGSAVPFDCDDRDASVFPGSPAEVCGDAIAHDCGVGPPCRYSGEWSVAKAHRIVGTTMAEEAGAVIAGAGDTNGDGLADFLSYSRGGAGVNLVLGPADIATFDEATASIPDTMTYVRPPVGVGDLDADGFDDVLVTTTSGSYVLSGPLSGTVSPDEQASARIGFLITRADGVGDWDGDLHPDLAYTWQTGSLSTALAVFPGPPATELSPESAMFTVRTTANGYQLGKVTGRGDYDADGRSDLLGSSDQANLNGTATGAAWLFYGGATGERAIEDSDAEMRGVNPYERAAYSIDMAGDVNADGYDDIVIGSFTQDVNWGYRVDQTAVASLVYGPVYGQLDLDEADARYECDVEPISCSVAEVRGAGDMDGDGFGDFAVSNPVGWRRDGSYGGAWLFYGPVEGHHSIAVADAALVGEFPIITAYSMDGVGDLDGDGLGDLVLGAPWWRESAESAVYDRGAAYVVFGGAL